MQEVTGSIPVRSTPKRTVTPVSGRSSASFT
jgi:hypothetical protein